MNIEFHILNKSKKKTIVFLHGMFASGGFWLPYIKSFKSYRLVILTIDFLNLLKNSESIIEKELMELHNEINIIDQCIWICHSLGCSFYNAFIRSQTIKNFQICPVMLGKKREFESFVSDIALILEKPIFMVEDEAKKIHYNMNKHLLNKSQITFKNSEILVPSNDQYFLYPSNNLVSKRFTGDHYDIQNAIDYIKENL